MDKAFKDETLPKRLGRVAQSELLQTWPRLVPFSPLKRCTDIIGAAILLVFFAPLLALIAAILYFRYGGDVLFRHERLGRNGDRFACLKFRTMHQDSQKHLTDFLAKHPLMRQEWERTQKLAHDPRVHGLGRILRKSSLDELPQLINVLRGEMSLVGPRPITSAEAEKYAEDFAYYLALRPGITGLWQVSGRNDTTYAERVAFDVQYYKNRTFLLDIKILLRTIAVVFTGKGAC
ncbi:sugar transferase [Yoonia sp. BS5-3]|uniref:Sugar transferase n=1 Tax=Yoonia phaeophyticola TaxID=3137369 RepID=A0ABZ3IE75_9RHOB